MKNYPYDQAILLFMKAPRPGNVKTRIAKSIGNKKAARLYRNFVMDIISMVETCKKQVIIFYHPEDGKNEIENLLGKNHIYFSQTGDNLGKRMQKAFEKAFDMGVKKGVLMGTDIPDLPSEIIESAFNYLDSKKSVIGPAFDGGYYLIGFRQNFFSASVFENIPWSTPKVFEKTLSKMKTLQIEPYILPGWRDMDSMDDLLYLIKNKGVWKRAPKTISYLAHLPFPEKIHNI